MTRLMSFLKRVAASRIGQILFLVHTILVVYVYASRESFSERAFHFHYEPLLFKVLIVLNLPALLVATIIGIPFAYLKSLSVNLWWLQWVIDATGFICVSGQWWVIGYCVERIFWRERIP
jgi:hypothetical protein